MSKKAKEKNCRLGAVGGQAVLEGVMMRHGTRCSVAVRRENGVITVSDSEFVSVRRKYKPLNLPIIRGVVNMVESLILSYRTLETSAEQFGLEEEEPKKKKKSDSEGGSEEEAAADVKNGEAADSSSEKKENDSKLIGAVMVIAMIFGLGLGILLFMFLPTFVTGLLDTYFFKGLLGIELGWWRNLIEGLMKIVIFVMYLLLVSLMKDIRRTFEYHGAEHKSIFCYEAGEELTPENVKKHSRFHPRCGTSFMFVIIIIGILVSSLPFITWENVFIRFATKLAMLPLIVGLGYEFIMVAGKHDNAVTRILSAPGLFIQRITTREPDLQQIEVAIHALKSSMPYVFPDFIPELRIDGDREITREEALAARSADGEDGQESQDSRSSASGDGN